MSGSTSADLKPALTRTLTSSRSASADADVGNEQRLERTDHHPMAVLSTRKDDVRTRPVAPLVLLDACGEGLELLAGLGQQRQPDAIAADQAGNPHRQRLERQADVDRARDDLQHRILRLQLLHLVQRRAVRVLTLGQPLAERADAARREHGEDDGHDPPPGDQRDRDDAASSEPATPTARAEGPQPPRPAPRSGPAARARCAFCSVAREFNDKGEPTAGPPPQILNPPPPARSAGRRAETSPRRG